jgi:hypothetical protein
VGIPFTVRFRLQLVVVSSLSVGRWDLGLHGAFGYQGASFTELFFLFLSLGYHRALSRFFFLTMELRLSRSLFMESFFHFGISAIIEPFHGIIISLWDFINMDSFFHFGISAITEPFHEIVLSLWDFGYHEAFSWNHSFTLGFRLSQSLLMESFFHFGISAITEPFHGVILSLRDFINMDSHKHTST